LSAGDTVYVRGGVYNEVVNLTASGTQANVITWIAYPGEDPVIDGNGLSAGSYGLVRIRDINYITWDGIDVYRSDGAGIAIGYSTNCDNILLKNAKIYDTQYSGIIAQSYSGYAVTNITIDNCEITNVNLDFQREAITIAGVGLDGFEVKNCTVHDTTKEGMSVGNGAINGSIHDNIAYSMVGVSFYVDAYDEDTANVDIYNNVAYDSTSVGIALATEQGGTLSNIKVYNNLVYRCKDGLTIYDYTARSHAHTKTDIQIFNNTFVDNSRWQIWIQDPAENFINLVAQNNIFAHSNAISVFEWDDWGNLIGATLGYNLFQTGTGFGSNIITGDPLFQDRGNNDYSLLASSPAVDAGSTAYAPSEDIDGSARPSGNGYDIGAYELTSTNQPTDVNNDGAVNVLDLISVGQHWEEAGPVGWRSEDVCYYIDKSIYLALN
jgi:hypothetical protein